ncbi:MAG: hypothetical protein JRH20_03365 [Deltaproteobacteria bacterium]|nr:hypothetical protein [Deltaproteobacteria bacterium]
MSTSIQQQLNALKIRPHDAHLMASVGELIAQRSGLSDEDRQLLERAREELRSYGRWDAVVRLIDAELVHIDGDGRADLLLLKGQVLKDELLDDEGAVKALQQALDLRPDDEEIEDLVEHIGIVRENWQRIAEKFINEAEAATDRGLATRMFLSAAEVTWRNNPDSERVEECLRRSLEIDARNQKASAHLERWLLAKGRVEELAGAIHQRAEVSTRPALHAAAMLDLGDLYLWAGVLPLQDVKIDMARALECYEAAFAANPRSARAQQTLSAIYEDTQNFVGLASVLAEEVRSTLPAEIAVEMLVRVGGLYANELDERRARQG